MRDATQQAAAHLVPLFLNLLQLGQHSGHAVLIEVTVLQQRSVFEPQIFHLLQVLWAEQVGQAQNPKNPGTSAHFSSGISSAIVFVLLGLNCLSHKTGLIIPSTLHARVSHGNFSLHLDSSQLPSQHALGSRVCIPCTCLLEAPSPGVGALGLNIYFLF